MNVVANASELEDREKPVMMRRRDAMKSELM